MRKSTFLIFAGGLLLASLAWVILTPVLFPFAQSADKAVAAHPGFQAPGFSLETPAGDIVSLSDHNGQPVLVFLWASWCPICKGAMPDLETVYQDYADQGFEILAVDMAFQDTLSTAIEYFQTEAYSYTMLIDRDGQMAQDYQMHGLPTSILVGPDGTVLDVTIGSGMSAGYLSVQLDQVFAIAEGE
ncbi:MAG: TlpA disulfide reductase family protein [Chloroflexota bacterium]|nr:TlpA disulfide reductase family protein [Chloroflexota bacterium]